MSTGRETWLESRRVRLLLCLLLALAALEVAAHFVIVANVPPHEDWVAAAAYVRGEKREHDLVTVAPAWADPLLRWVIGDQISLDDAGHADLAPYDRVFALTIRGARPRELADRPPSFTRDFGLVEVARWDLGRPSPVVYDFVKEIRSAEVTMVEGGLERACPWMRRPSHGGGLGRGPMEPENRFVCDPARPWLWVGPTVNEDLDLAPRRCVWQHPLGQEPVRATFHDVPLGDRIVAYADVYYEHERNLEEGPFDLSVFVDGRPVGRLHHVDGDGWKRAEMRVPEGVTRGDVTFETTAPAPHFRTVCWAASSRRGRE